MSIILPAGVTNLSLLAYAALAGGLLTLLFTLFLIPALLPVGAKPDAAGKSLFCYFLQTIGIALMSITGLPAIIGILAGVVFPAQTYLALLVIFVVGGILFLWNELHQHHIDAASRAVPELLFRTLCIFVGLSTFLLSIFALLSILLFTTSAVLPSHWWASSVALILWSLLLLTTMHERKKTVSLPSPIPTSFPPRPVASLKTMFKPLTLESVKGAKGKHGSSGKKRHS